MQGTGRGERGNRAGAVLMDNAILLGYVVGIITCEALSGYPENFKPTITENPRAYLITGVFIGAVAIALDLIEVWF